MGCNLCWICLVSLSRFLFGLRNGWTLRRWFRGFLIFGSLLNRFDLIFNLALCKFGWIIRVGGVIGILEFGGAVFSLRVRSLCLLFLRYRFIRIVDGNMKNLGLKNNLDYCGRCKFGAFLLRFFSHVWN